MKFERATEVRLARLSAACWLVSAVSKAWEFLAEQSPTSSFHVGLLPGPIEQLSFVAFVLGTACWIATFLSPSVFSAREPTLWVASLYVGVGATLTAIAYGAARGLYGIQLLDPRLDARIVVGLRLFGFGFLFACLLTIVRRLFVPRM